MRRYGLILAALLVLPWLLGCSGQPETINVAPDNEFSLRLGQTASVEGEDLVIRFAEVISDSRCPEGAVCIWAGEVSARLEVTYAGVVNEKVLVQPGFSQPATADFADYLFTFDVQPYPQVGQDIKDDDYRLVMTVSKAAASRGAALAAVRDYR